ncbi:hypothetical protein CP368_06145 [Lactobacillus sp. UMNPBX17]|nr:hypothetical protein CP368_06145 [Lactobacillus sp. UMNPBX17]
MQVGATVVDPTNGHAIAIVGGRHLPNVALGYTLMTFFDLSADVNFHLVKSRVRQSITGVPSSQPRTADLQTCDNGHWQ